MQCHHGAGAGPREASVTASDASPSPWYVYLLRCADGTLYTGVATDLQRRLRQHNGELAGGAAYTRARRPVVLVWTEPSPDRASAQRREAAVRRLSRARKLHLTRSWTPTDPES